MPSMEDTRLRKEYGEEIGVMAMPVIS